MNILAIDLGLSKSVFCEFETTSGKYHFGTVATESARLQKLLEEQAPDLVVVEICPLAASVHDLAVARGMACVVADTTQDAWRWRNVKRKTDRDDALKLARLAALDQLNPVHIPAPRVRQWRQLIEQRQSLVAEQTRSKNRIRVLLRVHAEWRLPRGKLGWTQEQVAQLRLLAQPLAACPAEELWRGMLDVELRRLEQVQAWRAEVEARLDRMALADDRVRRVRSLPGVGPRVAEAIVATLDDPRRFATRRQVGAYAGLTPRRFQSGAMDRSGRISKRGQPHLRQLLNQAAWITVGIDEHFRGVYLRACRGSKKRRKIAIVAVMRRLLVVAWALLRDETRYRPAAVRPRAA